MATAYETMSSDTRSTTSQASNMGPHRSTNAALRSKKFAASTAKAIQNRIAYFKREEAKIWRDLEEVRRQTGKIEEGRARITEKKLADHAIMQHREQAFYANRLNCVEKKQQRDAIRERQEDDIFIAKRDCGEERRKESAEILQSKRMAIQQQRIRNSERAILIQRDHLDAKMRINEDKRARLSALREEAVKARANAAKEAEEIESMLPALEAEEMACLEKLQNSRLVTQNVLAELENSIGRGSVLRMRTNSIRHSSLPFLPNDRSIGLTSLTEESGNDGEGGEAIVKGNSALTNDGNVRNTHYESYRQDSVDSLMPLSTHNES